MKMPLLPSAQNSALNSKSPYGSLLTKKPSPLVASIAPFTTFQSTSPTLFQPSRLVPLNALIHPDAWPDASITNPTQARPTIASNIERFIIPPELKASRPGQHNLLPLLLKAGG